MDSWLQRELGLSADEAGLILALATIAIAFLGFCWRHRRKLTSGAHLFGRVSGSDRRRYGRWFRARYGKVRNIYLDRDEVLDLSATYISLSFQRRADGGEQGAGQGESSERTEAATTVLADRAARRILVTGDPGTGKSTLLKAYGTAILRPRGERGGADLKLIGRSRDIPLFVPLRFLARHLDGRPDGLVRYLESEVLAKAGVAGAREFLRQALDDDRCLLLLDGLDEVPDHRYGAVRDAIFEFCDDGGSAGLPTQRARVVLTCRRQNFKRIQPDWIPAFAVQAHALAPLQDAEIFMFLRHRESEFVRVNALSEDRAAAPRTPKDFFDAAMASETADLHRVPLVLTMSVGLYLSRPAYQIPRSVREFYRTMISHLVRRHDFPGSTDRKNRYDAEDKERFIREFALAMASRDDRFGDFVFDEMLEFAERLTRRLARVPDAESKDFVNEIIDNTGLFSRVSDAEEYAFSHRSIQEHLAADQLARDPAAGAAFLLERVGDSDWRQVVLFFAAFDHDHTESFVRSVGERNPELAGNCLSAGLVSDEVARPILDELLASVLREVTADRLAALVAAVRAPRESVRDYAARKVSEALTSPVVREHRGTLIADDREGTMRLIQALATTNVPSIAAQVVLLADLVAEDEHRLVGPLWSALSTPDMVDRQAEAARIIVLKLLSLAMDPLSFAALEQAPPHRPALVTTPVTGPALLRRAYPFDAGLDRDSNIVTLLAWAEELEVVPEEPTNRFFEAKEAGMLGRIEQDRRWTLSIAPFRPVRFLFLTVLGAALLAGAYNVVTDPGLLTRAHGWWTPALALVPAAVAVSVAFALSAFGYSRTAFRVKKTGVAALCLVYVSPRSVHRESPPPNNMLTYVNFNGVDYDGEVWFDRDTMLTWLFGVLVGLPYVLAALPLMDDSLVAFLIGTTALVWVAFWLPATRLFNRSRRFYLRKPNPFVDVYEDARSRHWLVP
ncbi:NACHT domain-containing protein [Phytohabitans houttuyneae]|uniref:NACHT domain-containing protein n=1 Tax=Phytohabitans houttuyneae TaxID=1076126 RepID=A0A6V8JWB2_9ACTN|nr:hypothetical protein [Phytohabitans houttuyneae]GFJ76932.1 hypothetical protein Phou_011120 [Phytohabitans houttuyneae]